MILQEKKVLVLGLGETGLSMVKWLTRQNANVRVADTRADPPGLKTITTLFPELTIHTGPFSDAIFDNVDLIAISPGVPLADPHVQQAIHRGTEIVGDMDLFAWALQQDQRSRPKIIAITGSNGKTTVTAMTGALLKKAGWNAAVAGNISPSVLDTLMQRMDANDWPQAWVLELSSFQLETMRYLDPDISTVLNISEDHLDRYVTITEYAAAKARIFMHTQNRGVQVLNRNDRMVCDMALPDRKQFSFGLDNPLTANDFGLIYEDNGDTWLAEGNMRLMESADLPVVGLHNAANALAALAMCRALEIEIEPLVSALKEFRGLPHRMEKVATINGITFYDDSKATNVGSTIAALTGLNGNAVVIAGGEGKGQNFLHLRAAISTGARAVILMGRDAQIIASALQGCGVPLYFADTLPDAVQKSFLLAQKGDLVLLPPACASLDMFRNYIHRAEVFVAAVKDIAQHFNQLSTTRQ